MTTTEQNSIGSEVGRRVLRAAIAIAGLIVIRPGDQRVTLRAVRTRGETRGEILPGVRSRL